MGPSVSSQARTEVQQPSWMLVATSLRSSLLNHITAGVIAGSLIFFFLIYLVGAGAHMCKGQRTTLLSRSIHPYKAYEDQASVIGLSQKAPWPLSHLTGPEAQIL